MFSRCLPLAALASSGQGQTTASVLSVSSRGLNIVVGKLGYRDRFSGAMIALSSINKTVVFRSTYRGG